MSYRLISPRDFIRPPYVRCPKCGQQTFGILGVSDQQYFRRCYGCLYPKRDEKPVIYPLPVLKKKIIYLDQFAISNMVKFFYPEVKVSKTRTIDSFYKVLFDKIHRLTSLQLVICPDSSTHLTESLLSSFFPALKRMYELFSHGTSFYDIGTIRRFQINLDAKKWISKDQAKGYELDDKSIIHGNHNRWLETLIISANIRYDPEFISRLKATRNQGHKGATSDFERWKAEKNKSFNDWYEECRSSFGPGILQDYQDGITSCFSNPIDNPIDLLESLPFLIVATTHDIIKSVTGLKDHNKIKALVEEYFLSPSPKELPFTKIFSLIWAGLAKKAKEGGKKPPNQGMLNDMVTIAGLLPYCDAMFIDKECYSLLTNGPINKMLTYKTRLFSPINKSQFLDYLDELEKNAPKKILKKVYEVYGEVPEKYSI